MMPMKYIAYLKQKGEGCDYTIGCAHTVIDLEASSIEEAIKELTSEILDSYGSDEVMLDEVELYEVAQVVKIPVKRIYDQRDEFKAQQAQNESDEAERIEFERLKQKFG